MCHTVPWSTLAKTQTLRWYSGKMSEQEAFYSILFKSQYFIVSIYGITCVNSYMTPPSIGRTKPRAGRSGRDALHPLFWDKALVKTFFLENKSLFRSRHQDYFTMVFLPLRLPPETNFSFLFLSLFFFLFLFFTIRNWQVHWIKIQEIIWVL